MPQKAAVFTVTLLTGLTAMYLLARQVAPGPAAQLSAYVRENVTGWNDTSCAADPIGCLYFQQRRLKVLEQDVGSSINGLRTELSRVDSFYAEQQNRLQQNKAFLEQGKRIYAQREGQPDQPVVLFGRTYGNLFVLKQQLSILFAEGTSLAKIVSDASRLRATLQGKLDILLARQGEIIASSSLLPAKLELLRVNIAVGDMESTFAAVSGIISRSEAGLVEADTLFGSTADLAKSAQRAGGDSANATFDPQFEDFLKGERINPEIVR